MIQTEEKKVEYVELIYDLIFVYLIGRNNSILHYTDNGIISLKVYFMYVLLTLAVIQIWSYSSVYINLYGKNSIRNHIFLFINMYLLYHMANGIKDNWQESFYQFNIAWFLIIINITIQNIIEIRNYKAVPWQVFMLKRTIYIMLGEALLILIHMLVFTLTGISIAFVPLLFSIIAVSLSGRTTMLVPVDFNHLTERAMLYVVFTFGEMIISISSYFKGGLTFNTIYFSIMAFLIVAGLFVSYELMYNRIIDREKITNGTGYMMLHLFLILALNNISVALEFMREEEINLLFKTLFITISLVVYFIFMLLMGIYAKKRLGVNKKFVSFLIIYSISFMILMALFREYMYINIIITVLYVAVIFITLYLRSKSQVET